MKSKPIVITDEANMPREPLHTDMRRDPVAIVDPKMSPRVRDMRIRPGSIAAALLIGGAMAGLTELSGAMRNASGVVRKADFRAKGKRSRDPGIRKQRDKAKASRKARIKNKGR